MPHPLDTTFSTAPRSIEANLAHRTLSGGHVQGDKVAIWHRPPGERQEIALTFDGLREDAGRVAGYLRARGIGMGDRVLILVPMSAALYAIMLGVAQVGASCVFIDPSAGLAHLETACRQAGLAAVFAVPAARWLGLASPALRRIPHSVTVDRGFAAWLRRMPVDSAVEAVSPEDTAAVAYTTGSTGEPKPVRRSHGYIVAQLEALGKHASKGSSEVDMPMWPMLLFDALCHGRTSVIPEFPPGRIAQADPAQLLDQMRRHGVTLLSGPPALYERLLAHCERTGEQLPVRYAFVGGAMVMPELLKRIQASLLNGNQANLLSPPGGGTGRQAEGGNRSASPPSPALPHEGGGSAFAVYGSTEVEPVAILSAAELDEAIPSQGLCAGSLHPDLSLRLVRPHQGPIALDDAGWADWEVAPGDVGEIVVAGPHVCVDYMDDPTAFAANKIVDPDGRVWHRMGDLGTFENGRLHLMGRLSHVVATKRGPCYSLPCEHAAMAVPSVHRAALVGRDGEAWLVAEPTADADLHELEANLLEALKLLPVDRVVFHPDLPVDARHNSKVDHQRLLADLPSTPPVRPARETPPALPRALAAYMAERYPMAKNLVGTTLMVAADGFATLALMGAPLSGQLLGRMALMAGLYWLVFFHLRVFDEHKDWRVDRVAFPERVLTRGWVTLKHLRVAAGLALGGELLLALSAGPVVTVWTLVLVAYTALMFKEFFVGEWLRRHFVLYGVSHMAIISLMSLAAYGALLDVVPGPDHRLWHPSLLLFAAMNFCMVYSLEVARKIRMPEAERPSVDTYSKYFGIPASLATVLGLQAAGMGLLALAARDLHVHPAAFWLGGGAYALVALVYIRFGRAPNARDAKKLESVPALTYLLLNVALIVTWGWFK